MNQVVRGISLEAVPGGPQDETVAEYYGLPREAALRHLLHGVGQDIARLGRELETQAHAVASWPLHLPSHDAALLVKVREMEVSVDELRETVAAGLRLRQEVGRG